MNIKALMLAAITTTAVLGSATSAKAAYTITFLEVGQNVVATGTGTLNTTGLEFRNSGGDDAFISPGRNIALIGGGDADLYFATLAYQGVLGTGGGIIRPGSSTGGVVGGLGGLNLLAVPGGYRSGSATTGTSTFTNSTFQSLGLTPGTVTVSFNSGANADTITYQIGPVAGAVPEPATWAMMLVGFGGIGFAMRRRKSKVRTTVSYA